MDCIFRYINYYFDMSNKREIPRRTPRGMTDYEGDRQFATTLARGMELLRCFTPQEPMLGNRELSRRLQLPAPTVSRLTYTLVAMGYLAQDEQQSKYRLGSGVLSLAYPLLEMFNIRRRARPLMLEMSRAVHGSVSIGIRDRFNIVYIEAIHSDSKRIYPLDVGTRHSLAGTAIGRAYMMACSPPEREALLNQLRLRAPEEWTRHGTELTGNISQYPARGCCISMGELYPDVQAVAVPLGRIDRGEIAALNCSFQGRAFDKQWLIEKIAPQLQTLVRQLI